ASLTLSDETLEECAALAGELGVGFHIHVAEDVADVEDSLKKSGLRAVERLERLGILGPRTIAAHCVHINEREMELLRETGTKVAHNPRSNMNNAVGVAPVLEMLRRGITVGLGNDGFSNNMFTEMHAAYLVHKLARRDPRAMGADKVLRMAFQNNAQIAAPFFGLNLEGEKKKYLGGHPPSPPAEESPCTSLGELSVGAWADIILVDYRPPTPLTADNLPWHIIFGVDGTQVDTTIVGGKVLMRGRELLTLDEEEICAKARELAAKVWERI
ncbi:MAG TPA: chlorohydrolase, partial [Anaerolineae bacterium]|nr:chlorohydrolase [Anaerolineae bacterium]